MELLTLILSNLNRRRRSMIIVWIWVIISTIVTILLASAASGTEQITLKRLESLVGINQITVWPGSGGANLLSEDTLGWLKSISNVMAVIPVDYVYGEISLGPYICYPSIVGVELEDLSVLGYSAAEGNSILKRGEVILGYEIPAQFIFRNRPDKQASRLDLLGEIIKLTLTKYSTEGEEIQRTYSLPVAGILARTGEYDIDYSIFISISNSGRYKEWLYGQSFNRKVNGYDKIIVIASGVENVEAIHQTIASYGYWPDSRLSDTQQIRETAASLRYAAIIVGVMSLIGSAIGVFLTMLTVIVERKSEIGLMKAVGATDRLVLAVFIGEAATVGFLGGMCGIILGKIIQVLFNYWINRSSLQAGEMVILGQDLTNITLSTPVWLVAMIVVFTTMFSLIAGVIPAKRAADLEPIEALRDI